MGCPEPCITLGIQQVFNQCLLLEWTHLRLILCDSCPCILTNFWDAEDLFLDLFMIFEYQWSMWNIRRLSFALPSWPIQGPNGRGTPGKVVKSIWCSCLWLTVCCCINPQNAVESPKWDLEFGLTTQEKLNGWKIPIVQNMTRWTTPGAGLSLPIYWIDNELVPEVLSISHSSSGHIELCLLSPKIFSPVIKKFQHIFFSKYQVFTKFLLQCLIIT